MKNSGDRMKEDMLSDGKLISESERSGRHRGGRHKGKHHHHHGGGAQTFRRGRALEFLERLRTNRDTLEKQLGSPELQEIKPVMLGELKAIEMIIDQYTQHFELHERMEMKEKDALEALTAKDDRHEEEMNVEEMNEEESHGQGERE
ncbi:hypothetical protein [Paenibacillus sp. HB172176]|uniref:hypothetical protein n=1 Tax=Paenibacillus sp. HB172176 TaxID=2493690 RepID=UPI0019816AC6|nr:hypothetical protein [Paenibacillus sp. HB172176]